MVDPALDAQQAQEGPQPAPGRGHQNPSRGQVKRSRDRHPQRDQRAVPESPLVAGRFGRMFRNLPSFEPTDATIEACLAQMLEAPQEGTPLDNPRIPAGFTYLGQFIDHDLTFDPVSELQRQNDPEGLRNFRTPNFDLDSVYGLGRDDQPYLYQRGDREKLAIGRGTPHPQPDADIGFGPGVPEHDLPRNVEEVALVGDSRNDENILVSQLQLAFLKLHNRLVDDIRASLASGDVAAGQIDLRPHLWAESGEVNVFREAQRLTRWHYQWIVLSEFLPLICGDDYLRQRELLVKKSSRDGDELRIGELRYYRPEDVPFIPVEWSVAAYRYGHSQIRPTYNLSAVLTGVNPDINIFVENPDAEPLRHLGGGRRLPALWTIDWRFFFEQNPPDVPADQRVSPQLSRLIDTRLAAGLQHLPGIADGIAFLARRNLLRGRALGLPSGQAVARRLHLRPLDRDELRLDGEAPLWFYILREAEVRHGGVHLGTVGARIVAEVFLGIMREDRFSFLRTEPGWQPVLPATIDGDPDRWGMADLLAYAVPDDGRVMRLPSGPSSW